MFKKTLIPCLLLVLLLGPLSTVNAQDNVGIGTLSPSSDAILDLFSNNKGFLAPRVTSAERATIPANSSGLLVFDTDENKFFYWNSALSLWQVMDDFSNTNELLQIAAFDETTKQITLTDRGATYTLDLNILSQQLSFRNDTLFISDKNEIDLGIYNKDSSATNELQSLTISNDTIFIDRRGFIKLSEDEFWNTDGNVGTTPLTHFIGTTDNQDLIIKTDNTERVRILGPNGNFGIGTTTPDEKLDVEGNIELNGQIRIRGGAPGVGKVLMSSDAVGLATWQDVPVVENGLNKNTNTIRLGGPLVTNTTITQGTRNMIFNLNNSGDFIVQDNGVTQFTVQDNGRVGIGTTSPDEKLDVEGSGRFGIDGKLTINTRTTGLARVGNDGFLSGGRFVSYGPEIVALQTTIDDKNIGYDISSYGGGDKRHVLALQPDGGYVGIGTLTASSQLDLSEQIRIRGGNPGNGKVLTSDANGLATWQKGIPSVSNGLNVNTGANSIRLGGPLVETTTITQGRFGIVFDQDNTLGLGDFTIKSQGVAKFRVNAWGDTRFGSDVYFMDESVSGRRLVQITDEGPDNDDGRIRIFENGLSSVDLNAGRYFDFNQQRLDRNFKISSVGDENMFFLDASADRIGIGTSTPSQVLEVAGNILANGNLIRSDKRWKTKIELISNALEKLDQINGYTYKWKVGTDTTPQVGVIAQEIELVLPEAVKTDAEGYKSVDYGKLSALLIEAVKEQQTIITSLENKIDLQNTAISDVKNVQKSLDERLLILEKK